VREKTGWVSAGDGLLAVDANHDGIINNITELFGNATQNGFAALAPVFDFERTRGGNAVLALGDYAGASGVAAEATATVAITPKRASIKQLSYTPHLMFYSPRNIGICAPC
jgi:hypothetical protein